jgi:hypothetical protein
VYILDIEVLEAINLLLAVLGGALSISVFRRLRGGTMASGIFLVLLAGGVFAIHEAISALFSWIWPQPWYEDAYRVSETVFIVVFVLAIFRLRQSVPRGV